MVVLPSRCVLELDEALGNQTQAPLQRQPIVNVQNILKLLQNLYSHYIEILTLNILST